MTATPGGKTSLFDDPMRRADFYRLLGRAQSLTSVGHGVVAGDPASLGSTVWADQAFAALQELLRVAS